MLSSEKKVWSEPKLESLKVTMTMTGMTGTVPDGIVYEVLPDGSTGDESMVTHGQYS